MDFSTLIRDPQKVKSHLITREDHSVVCKQGCKIYFPIRFESRFMAEIGVNNLCVGLFAVVVEDKYYSLVSVNAMLGLKPSIVNKVAYDNMEYYELIFESGSIVIESLELVENTDILFRLYDELFSKGKIPWYVGYEDLAKVYDTSKKYTGSNANENPEVLQLLTSLVSRDKANRNIYYRQVIKSRQDLIDNPPAYIPLRSVNYAATNTVNKLAGSYFSDGLTSALLNPSDRVETIERLLRA